MAHLRRWTWWMGLYKEGRFSRYTSCRFCKGRLSMRVVTRNWESACLCRICADHLRRFFKNSWRIRHECALHRFDADLSSRICVDVTTNLSRFLLTRAMLRLSTIYKQQDRIIKESWGRHYSTVSLTYIVIWKCRKMTTDGDIHFCVADCSTIQ